MSKLKDKVQKRGALEFGDLKIGDVVRIRTLNSVYQIEVLYSNKGEVVVFMKKEERFRDDEFVNDEEGFIESLWRGMEAKVIGGMFMRIGKSFIFFIDPKVDDIETLHISNVQPVKVNREQVLP